MGDFRRRLWAARPTGLRKKPAPPPEASYVPHVVQHSRIFLMENLYVSRNDTFLRCVSFEKDAREHSKQTILINRHDSLISSTFFKKGSFFKLFWSPTTFRRLFLREFSETAKSIRIVAAS